MVDGGAIVTWVRVVGVRPKDFKYGCRALIQNNALGLNTFNTTC